MLEAPRAARIQASPPVESPVPEDKCCTGPEPESRCGIGPCAPPCLQVCAVPVGYLVCISTLVLVQSFIVSGYSSSILTTIEKRYNLYSGELGFIISSYDITAVLAGIVVSYFGDAHNRAAWLSRGALLIALGAGIFALPHFVGNEYIPPNYNNVTGETITLCNDSESTQAGPCGGAGDSDNSEKWALAVFMSAFMVIGVGASPIYTLGPTYLYDNMSPARYPVYSAIMYSMGALGPAAGFLVGAALLQFYVHPGLAPPGLSPSSPAWVGAWWLGFLIMAGLAVAVSFPLGLFPKKLPGSDRHTPEEDPSNHASFCDKVKVFPQRLCRMLRNMMWLGITLTSVTEQSIGTGFNRFIAKYMELSFKLSPTAANLYTGCVLIPAAVLGIVSGGVLMNKLRPTLPNTARFLLALNVLPTVLLAVLLTLSCDTIHIVGITDMDSASSTGLAGVTETLNSACNAECACERTLYAPVCGADRRTYFNACYAGCTHARVYLAHEENPSITNFSSCGCITEMANTTVATAEAGRCTGGCRHFVPFLIILFVVVFSTTCGHNPAIIMTLRSVDANSRSFALGIQNFFLQLFAFIPAPIYFGQIFDALCMLRATLCDSGVTCDNGVPCDNNGVCLEYNTGSLPYALFGTCLGLKVFTFIFLGATWWAACRNQHRKATYSMQGDTTLYSVGAVDGTGSMGGDVAPVEGINTISASVRDDL